MSAPRFPRLTTEEMSDVQRAVTVAIETSPRKEVRGPFIALLHDPDLAYRVLQLGTYLRWGGKLPAHLKELAVLVTARKWTCHHEWLIHEPIAREAGLADHVIESIAQGREPRDLPADVAAVYRFCKEAHASGRVSDEAFSSVKDRFGLDGTLELLALCGYFSLTAMVLNTAGLPLPHDAPPPLRPL